MTRADKREVIFQYNRSEPYVETVLGMAQLLEKPMKQEPKQSPLAYNSSAASAKATFAKWPEFPLS